MKNLFVLFLKLKILKTDILLWSKSALVIFRVLVQAAL